MWYAGIDWADQHHDVVVIDEQGKQRGVKRVAHTAAGLDELVAFLKAVGDGDVAAHPDHLACIIETNKGLLITALLEAGLPVYPVNPKTLQAWRKPAGAKTDQIDAWLLARKGRSDLDQLHRLEPDSPLIGELKQLTRDQDGLIQMQTRLVNQLTACLKASYPVATRLFTKLQQPLTLAFLRAYPTLDAVRGASEPELAATLRAAKHPHPERKAHNVWQAVQAPQLHADAVTQRTQARLLLALLAQLEPVMDAIAAYDREIDRLLQTHADAAVFTSLPGAGRRLAPRLLAEWGDDRSRYVDAASVQALAGTAPVAFQSGKFSAVRRRRACNKVLRNAIQHFAWESTRVEPWADAYYRRKRQEGKAHTVAVRALANQWVRVIYAIWRKHERYDAPTFLAAQQAHARPAA
jgi:transposase